MVGYIDPTGIFVFLALVFAVGVLALGGVVKLVNSRRTRSTGPMVENGGLVLAAVAFAPLLFVLVSSAAANRVRTQPEATASSEVSLGPEDPIVALDLVVTLRGGVTDLWSQLRLSNSSIEGDLTAGEFRTQFLPTAFEDPNGYGKFGCTDCTVTLPVIVFLRPFGDGAGRITFEMEHIWEWDPYDPEVPQSELPEVEMEFVPSDANPRRLALGTAAEEVTVSPDRPLELVLVTASIDPRMIGNADANAWPTIQSSTFAFVPADEKAAASLSGGMSVVDERCREFLCLENNYVVDVRPEWTPESGWTLPAAASATVWLAHWIDTIDSSLPDGGSVAMTTRRVAAGAWLEGHQSQSFFLPTDVAYVNVEFDLTAIPDDVASAGRGLISLTGPDDVIVEHGGSRVAYLETCAPCTYSFFIRGEQGDEITVNVDTYYGFFDIPSPPAGAEVRAEVSLTAERSDY